MKVKIFLFCIGVLVLFQMLIYIQIRDLNEQEWTAALANVDERITTQKSEIFTTKLAVKEMEKDKRAIPETILKGVDDPEGKFLMFMDYLDNSALRNLKGTYDVSNDPIIKYKPVPLQQTDFHIQFEFEDVKQLELLLSYLLDQKGEVTGYPDYPLKVNSLKIVRVPENKPIVDLNVSLLLPAHIPDADTKQQTGRKSIGS